MNLTKVNQTVKMDNSKINSKCNEYIGKETKKSKNLHIRLMGHCIICLKKVNDNNGGSAASTSSDKLDPKSIESEPGFLKSFNQVWAVLQSNLKEKNSTRRKDDGKALSEEIGISLQNVLQIGGGSTNVIFSRAPTMCQYCSGKVIVVQNLMKALRQQVREIQMLFEEGRSGQDGGLGEFEKSLREKGLEENVIRATLEFVGIFPHQGRGAEDDDDGEPEDYVKEEPEEGDNWESIDKKDGSEEEMEVDGEEDKYDLGFQDEVEKDPLADRFPEKRKDISLDESKFPCSCGRSFATFKRRRDHMRRSKETHPEYKPFTCTQTGSQQICDLCGEWVFQTDILQHYTDHLDGQEELVMKCPNEKCPYMFVSQRELSLHLHSLNGKECKKIWKEKGGPVCEICGFKGKNMMVIRNHMRDKHESGKEKKWRCPISNCGKMFCEKQSFNFHMSLHHRYVRGEGITNQNCDKCGEDLKVEEMEGHLKDEHGIEEVIGCKQCNFKFSGRDEMVEHLYEHRRIGIICDICGVDKFARYCDFREHYFGVHKLCPKKFKCGEGECDVWFWRKETKNEHERYMHKNVRKGNGKEVKDGKKLRLKCDLCDYEYSTEEYLMSHKIRVHGEDPLGCDICGETFDNRKKLNKHKKEHAGIVMQNEWKCEVEGCGKTFKTKKLWKHHKEVGHGGERRHVCEECGKGFTFAKSLSGHRDSVHLGLRPWVCEECGEGFSSSTSLKRHKLIHTGERPFECEICGQRFRHKEVLGTHVRGHMEKGAGFKPNGPMKQLRKRKAV